MKNSASPPLISSQISKDSSYLSLRWIAVICVDEKYIVRIHTLLENEGNRCFRRAVIVLLPTWFSGPENPSTEIVHLGDEKPAEQKDSDEEKEAEDQKEDSDAEEKEAEGEEQKDSDSGWDQLVGLPGSLSL